MNEHVHTPGPWMHVMGNKTRRFQEISIRTVRPVEIESGLSQGLVIASVRYPQYWGKANANLIAAAPELLLALRRAQQVIAQEMLERGVKSELIHNPLIGSALQEIDAAIAKATGEIS